MSAPKKKKEAFRDWDSPLGEDAKRPRGNCGSCGKDEKSAKLELCAGCKVQLYCVSFASCLRFLRVFFLSTIRSSKLTVVYFPWQNVECQKQHWKAHKEQCKYIQLEFGTDPWHSLLRDHRLFRNIFRTPLVGSIQIISRLRRVLTNMKPGLDSKPSLYVPCSAPGDVGLSTSGYLPRGAVLSKIWSDGVDE